ncbi:MAG TPA: penicillin-binding protein 1C [Thermoanaerobaculia bacterium]|nr:penicillin-binding protein 1C [Thermoanaerobaculia bacterium]
MKRLSVVGCLLLAAFGGWVLFGPIPPIPRVTSATIVDRNGVVLYEPLGNRGERGTWIAEVPPNVARATIAAEDRRFQSHLGIDPIAIARAAAHDLRRGGLVEGGSTITQQVAKQLLNSDNRGLIAKLHESIVALRLERRYTKRAILAMYVNLAPYGNQIRGIGRASRTYFGVAPQDLTVAQAAFLAALPQRPGSIPHAMKRQRYVLAQMHASSEARVERLRFDKGERSVIAQHFIEHIQPAGSVIRTTLDAKLQRTVQGVIAAHRDDLLRHGAHSVAVAVLDNATGEWLAWEGSGDYFGSNFGGAIDGVTALRQPGSTLKPFTYAVAFERGFSPATVLPDVPASFPTAQDGIVYTPRNYDGQYRGPLRARAALAGSENVPAVALLASVGTPSLLRLLRNAGFSDLDKSADYYGLGVTLGDAEVRLEQLVVAYSVFARGGTYIEPRSVLSPQSSVLGSQTRGPRTEERGLSRRLLSPRTCFWITDILSDSSAREFIFGRGGSLDFPFPVAVKTGTSQAYRDNWTVGYTRDVTVGVWVGNFDRTELHHSSGITGAAPIFHDVMMAAATPRETILDPPANVERAPVCALSGLRPSTSCPNVEEEWVATEAPVKFCSWHHSDGVAWPAEYRVWAKTSETPKTSEVRGPRTDASLRVTNPPDGATYLIDPTLRKAFQTLRLRAVSDSRVAWSVDQRKLGVAERDAFLEWPLAPGSHTITATDTLGQKQSVRIFVK